MFFFPPTKISPVLMAPTKSMAQQDAVRKCLDHLKAAGRRTIPTEDTYFEQLHDKEFSPEEAFLDKDFKDRIRHLWFSAKEPLQGGCH